MHLWSFQYIKIAWQLSRFLVPQLFTTPPLKRIKVNVQFLFAFHSRWKLADSHFLTSDFHVCLRSMQMRQIGNPANVNSAMWKAFLKVYCTLWALQKVIQLFFRPPSPAHGLSHLPGRLINIRFLVFQITE